MKKKSVLTILSCVLAATVAGFLFTACKSKGPKLTLSADGGTLSAESLRLSAGASVSEALSSVEVTPEDGLRFAGWYEGDSPVAEDRVLPEEGLSLTAKFYTSYSVELFYRASDGTYPAAPQQTETGEAIYHAPFSYTPAAGTIDASAQNKTETSSLEKNEQFTAHVIGGTVYVTFLSNLPSGADFTAEVPAQTVKVVGETIGVGEAVPSVRNYRFVGWAETRTGDVVFRANEQVTVLQNLLLYAVWQRGAEDLSGGEDIVFFSAEDGKAYLSRPGLETKVGDYSAATRLFTFHTDAGKTLTGRLNPSRTNFSWYEEEQAEVTFVRYDFRNSRKITTETLTLDGYDRATHTVNGTSVEGNYYLDESGDYYFDGNGQWGEDLYFRIDDEQDTFLVRESSYGVYSTSTTDFDSDIGYPHFDFDGFGRVVITQEDGSSRTADYTFSTSDAVATVGGDETDPTPRSYFLTTTYARTEMGYVRIRVCVPNDGLGNTYTDGENTLVLDGYGNATYNGSDIGYFVFERTTGSTSVTYLFLQDASYNTYYLKLTDTAEAHTFELFENEEMSDYNPLLSAGNYSSAVLRLYGDSTAAILFPFTSSEGEYTDIAFRGTYREATDADGQYSQEGEGDFGTFVFQRTETVPQYAEAVEQFADQFENFVFRCGIINESVTYYSQYVDWTDGTFTGSDGTLMLNGFGMGTYFDGNATHEGIYVVEHDAVMLIEYLTVQEYYFSVDGSNFTKLGQETGTHYLFDPELGAINLETTLYLNGRNNATYTPQDGEEKEEKTAFYTSMGGGYTLDFDDETPDFRFTLDTFARGSINYPIYIPQNELGGTYTVRGGGRITVNDFCSAVWETGTSTRRGLFFMEGNGYAFLERVNGEFIERYPFAALSDGKELIPVSAEQGEYFLFEKGILRETTLVLDGHGGMKLISNGNEETGTYSVVATGNGQEFDCVTEAGDRFRVLIATVYTNDGDEAPVYIVYNDGAGTAFAHENGSWETLVLDGYRNATYVNERGIATMYYYDLLDEVTVRLTDTRSGAYTYFRVDKGGKTFTPLQGDTILSGDGSVLYAYLGSETAVVLNDSVAEVAEDAFYRTNVESVNLNNATKVGSSAFSACATLTSVTANRVQSIGEFAFFECIYLTEIDLPAIQTIGAAAFRYCQELNTVNLGEELVSIGGRAFYGIGRNARVVLAGGVCGVVPKEDGADPVFTTATVVVKDYATALLFLADPAWQTYAENIACQEDAPATYYARTLVNSIEFDGRLKKDGTVIGIYHREGNSLTVHPIEGDEKSYTFGSNSLTYEGVEYFAANTQLTYTDGADGALTVTLGTWAGTYNGQAITLKFDTAGKISFTLGKNEYSVTIDGENFTAKLLEQTFTNGTSSLCVTFTDDGIAFTGDQRIAICGRNIRSGMMTYGTPETVSENVYKFTITPNVGTYRYNVTATLDPAAGTFTYTASLTNQATLDGKTFAFTFTFTNDSKTADALTMQVDGRDVTEFSFTRGDATNDTQNFTLTVTDSECAGTYTLTLKTTTCALTLTKNA